MLLSVTKDAAGDSGLINMVVDEILFMEYDSTVSRIVVHTKDNEFYTVGSLVYWTDVLNKSGFRFKRSDRNDIVNIDKIKVMDSTRNVAYFEYPISENSKRCTFAEEKFRHTLKTLSLEISKQVVSFM